MQAENILVDTLSVTKRLQASGMPKKQAEAVAQEQVHFANNNLATKSDIILIHRDIEQLRSDTKNDIQIAMFKTIGITVTSIVTLMTIIQIVIQLSLPIG